MGRIITIGRQFGSGGRELGRRLAQELSIEYYDKEIITEISKHTSLSEEYVKQVVEHTPHSLYPITIGQSFVYFDDYTSSQLRTVYDAQNKIITDLAEKSDCVIVGRCADYILREKKPYKIFVYADIESRIKRCKSRSTKSENLTDKQLRKKIRKIDKDRARYYDFYTGGSWGNIMTYDLCVNTTDTEIKEIVPAIAKMFK